MKTVNLPNDYRIEITTRVGAASGELIYLKIHDLIRRDYMGIYVSLKEAQELIQVLQEVVEAVAS